jgi:hypothetical protein
MNLSSLLEEARTATPANRILWRDPIALHGRVAIDGVEPWLQDSTLAAFAIRVIQRVGAQGEPGAATKALRSARSRAPAHIQGDIDWALAELKPAARKPLVEISASPPAASRPAAVRPVRSGRSPSQPA